ncbi:hypothetical protein SLA2020_404280 [Shorea laevis]
MQFIFRSLPKPLSHSQSQLLRHGRTFVDDATTKWVRDRGLDHAVEKEKNLRPLLNLKNFIKSEPSKSVPISVITQNRDSLQIPIRPIDFVRRYPSVSKSFSPAASASTPTSGSPLMPSTSTPKSSWFIRARPISNRPRTGF